MARSWLGGGLSGLSRTAHEVAFRYVAQLARAGRGRIYSTPRFKKREGKQRGEPSVHEPTQHRIHSLALVFRRSLGVVDYESLQRSFCGFQFQAELFLDRLQECRSLRVRL